MTKVVAIVVGQFFAIIVKWENVGGNSIRGVSYSGYHLDFFNPNRYEIIGNIYENEDLLKD